MSSTNKAQSSIRPLILIAYGLLGLPLAAATLPLYVHIPNYYAVDLGLGLAAVGGAMFLMRIWDVVTDPLIGVLSDRIGGRYGRRRLWVGMGIPVAMLGGWMIFRPPMGVDIAYLVVAGLILHLGWTMVMLPYQAWGAELSRDYNTRNRIAAAREMFVIAGTLVAGGLVALAASPADRGQALGTVGLLLAIGLPLAAIPLFWKVPDPKIVASVNKVSWRQGLSVMASNRPFRKLLLAWVLNGVANGLPATLFILFVENIVGAPEQSGLYLLTYFLVAVAGMPVWLWIAGKIGKHRTWCVAMIWACGWFALAPLIGLGDGALYLALCIGTGFALGADLALPPSMQADVVDVDTATIATAGGGAARTGIYFALWGMATKLSLALAVGIAFPVLEWSGFQANSPATFGDTTLVLLYGVVPIIFKGAAIAVMWQFPLTAKDQEALKARIEGAR
ncbi:MAG: MFS transporter [Alphaproteobacteria bacterium]|nr:MFS transporter [Alphaproteobacteria bacterium]